MANAPQTGSVVRRIRLKSLMLLSVNGVEPVKSGTVWR